MPLRCRLDSWSATHVGYVRANNEDAYRTTPARGHFVLADGMGGHAGGEIASTVATEAAHSALAEGRTIRDAIFYANDEVLQVAGATSGRERMGTTLVVARVLPGELHYGWCGDSRVYLYRAGSLVRLTEDHGDGHVLNVYVGDPAMNPADIGVRAATLHHNDRILLCSDGLHGFVDEQLILHVLKTFKEPKPAANALVDEALKSGGHDNVTVTVIRTREI